MIIVLYLVLMVGALVFPPAVKAERVIFQDDFEREELSGWSVDYNQQWDYPNKVCQNAGLPAEWKIWGGMAGITLSGGGSCRTFLSPDELILPDNFEMEWEWYFAEDKKMDRNFNFLWQDIDNWYGLHIYDRDINIDKRVDGQKFVLANNGGHFDFQPEYIYRFKLRYENQLIQLWVNEQLVVETLDTPPLMTGDKTLALGASTGAVRRSVSYFDDLIVKDIDAPDVTELPVTLYKQNDTRWKNQIYDSAEEWTDGETNIERWGCALTSAVMILNYHGINQLPDGHDLTPSYLNVWLKNQPDGFVGEGLVNWLALTRLTQIMSPVLDTPILEYNYLSGEVDVIKTQIDLQQPAVLQVPGHFVVGYGYTPENEILIRDPYYDYQYLSQHDEFLSARGFTPSHTDLSYVMVIHSPDVEANFETSEDVQIYQEYYQDPTADEFSTNQPMIIQAIAKPESNTYTLNVSADEASKVKIYLYDEVGEVVDLSHNFQGQQTLEISLIDESLEIQSQTEPSPTPQASPSPSPTSSPSPSPIMENDFEEKISIDTLVDKISELYQQREIAVKFVELRLINVAQKISAEPQKFTGLFKYKLFSYSPFLTDQAKTVLLELSDQLQK